MIKIKTISIIILSFMAGTLINEFPIFVESSNCSNIPSYHIFYLKQIKACLEQQDKQLLTALDATNNVFFGKIEEINRRLNDTTK